MEYRTLGKTGLQVSEIGFGGEWLERHPEDESVQMLRYAAEKGINIVDCWMADPKSRDIIGRAMEGNRAHWIVQGHIGSTWQDGQYVRTRDMTFVRPAFEDLQSLFVPEIIVVKLERDPRTLTRHLRPPRFCRGSRSQAHLRGYRR